MGAARTGFRQASASLRQFGLRPARVKSCPKLSWASAAFAAVPLRKGLTDQTVAESDVVEWAASLSELVRIVSKTRNGKSENEQRALPPSPEDSGSESPAKTPSVDDSDAASKLKALQDLIGGGVDENKVREIIHRDFESSLAQAESNMLGKIKEAEDSVGDKVAQAVKEAAGMVPKVVEIKTADRVTKVEGQHHLFPALLEELGRNESVFICGPAGSGKTTGVVKACEALDRPYFIMRAVMDPFELLGFIDANGTYQESPIYRWAKTPGSVLIMDEIDRSNPKALIALNAVWNGIACFPTGQIEIPVENAIVATANTWGIGTDAEYVGSSRLDAATLNRFPSRLEWGYDESLETRIAVANGGDADEARYAQKVRSKIQERKIRLIWSPRDTVAHSKRVASGIPRMESFRRSVLATLSSTQFDEVTL